MKTEYICIDWGGSELKGTCLTDSGRRNQFKFSAGNLRQLKEEHLGAICQRLSEATAGDAGKELVWLIGAAGADDREAAEKLEKTLWQTIPTTRAVHIYSDYACNHAACLGGQDGILSINGTGSVLYAVFGEKKQKSGGWGFLLDETPSGAFFGRCALQGVLRHLDGEEGYGEYFAAFAAAHAQPDRGAIIDKLYRSASMQLQLGTYASVLTSAYAAKNACAKKVIDNSISALVSAAERLAKSLGANAISFCGSGGLWSNWPDFFALVEAEKQKQGARFTMTLPAASLHYGPLINFSKTDKFAREIVVMLKSTGDL